MREIRDGRCYTSCWAIQNSHFFYLSAKDFQFVLSEQLRRREIEMLQYIRKIPAFDPLTHRMYKSISKAFSYVVKIRGSKLFSQGEKANYIYIVR